MGIFNKMFAKNDHNLVIKESHESKTDINNEQLDRISLLQKHDKGELNDKTFLQNFGNVYIYYSTPVGDHIDGKPRLFALIINEKSGYLPVFITQDNAVEFYNKVGRKGFIIMRSSFISLLETLKISNNGNISLKLGAVIDPSQFGITIDVDNLDTVINMITSN